MTFPNGGRGGGPPLGKNSHIFPGFFLLTSLSYVITFWSDNKGWHCWTEFANLSIFFNDDVIVTIKWIKQNPRVLLYFLSLLFWYKISINIKYWVSKIHLSWEKSSSNRVGGRCGNAAVVVVVSRHLSSQCCMMIHGRYWAYDMSWWRIMFHLNVALDPPICASSVLNHPVVFDCSCLYAPVPGKQLSNKENVKQLLKI